MKRDVPAPGYQLISGVRNPRKADGGYWVQLRNGWCDMHGPWPVEGPRWIHDGSDFDVVAVKKA